MDAETAAGDDGAAAKSEPLGGAVGGEEGIAGTPGKENISTAGGNCGAAPHGPAFSPAIKDKEGPGGASGDAGVGT